MALTPKQEAFALAVVETGNQAEAYRRAYDATGMSPGATWVEASRLAANPLVSLRIEELLTDMARAMFATKARVIRELALLAFSDISELAPWDESGPHLIPSWELPRDKRALVKKLKVKRERRAMLTTAGVNGMVGDDERAEANGHAATAWEVEHFEVEQWDKTRALELLGRELGMFKQRVHVDFLDAVAMRSLAEEHGLDEETLADTYRRIAGKSAPTLIEQASEGDEG